ncbi:MAG TPA: hypothetical protein VLW75_07035 [Rhizomicrobium sp.]|nr:hypothetical protein [Rhizomicrobium sp.]
MARVVERHEESGRDLSATEARQAVALGHMRYVLAISTLLAVAAFAWILLEGV